MLIHCYRSVSFKKINFTKTFCDHCIWKEFKLVCLKLKKIIVGYSHLLFRTHFSCLKVIVLKCEANLVLCDNFTVEFLAQIGIIVYDLLLRSFISNMYFSWLFHFFKTDSTSLVPLPPLSCNNLLLTCILRTKCEMIIVQTIKSRWKYWYSGLCLPLTCKLA